MVIKGSGINQTVLFTHNDLDGVGCAILAKKVFGDDASIHMIMAYSSSEYIYGWMENQFNPSIHKKILVADLSVDRKTADFMEMVAPGICQIFDHHETAKKLNERDWCYVVDDGNDCGTTLLLKYLKSFYPQILEYRDFAKLVNCYDNQGFIPLTKEAYDMNLLLTILGKKLFINRFVEDSSVTLSDFENALLFLEYDRISRFVYSKMIRAFTMTIKLPDSGKEVKMSVAYANNYPNDVATALLEKFPDAPIACVVNLPSTFSFRMKGNPTEVTGITAMEVAKALGGGGHITASGAAITCEENVESLKNIFESKHIEIVAFSEIGEETA